MTIPPHASQEELETQLRADIRNGIRLVLLTGILLSPFCYLRCLLNPLWVLGLKVPGIFVTALFGCYVGWQYVNGAPEAGETAMLWWAVWAAIMLLLHYIFYAFTPINLYRRCKKYQPANTDTAPGIPAPHQQPLNLYKNAEGYQQAEFRLLAAQRGLYAIRWELKGYKGDFATINEEAITPPALSHHAQGETNCLTELYRLEAGTHRLQLRLADRDASRPESVTITQLND